MAQDFYELLRVTPSAAPEDIQNAFRLRTEHLVRRLQNARDNNADVSILRDEHKRLTAAKNILRTLRKPHTRKRGAPFSQIDPNSFT